LDRYFREHLFSNAIIKIWTLYPWIHYYCDLHNWVLNLSNYLYFGREIFWVSKSVLISIEETIEINTDLETPGSNINWHNLVFRGPIRRQPFGRGPGYSPTRPYVKMVQSWYSSNLSFEQFCSFLMLWFQPVVNFINILRTDFAPIFLHQKITKANFN